VKRRLILWLPLAVFAAFVLTVALGLYAPSSRDIPSQMVGKPMPDFVLPAALPGRPGLAKADLTKGQPHLVNVFASWCVPCIAEAPQLLALKQRGIPIEAIAIRDRPQDLADFLSRWGDPFDRIGSDTDSRVQLAMGSSGVPETFVVDGQGIIRHQHIGDIRPENVDEIAAAYEAAK
jgi:cytochrome c biogenesis protein CcmG, thiol:disulfide interchange protein DsbE